MDIERYRLEMLEKRPRGAREFWPTATDIVTVQPGQWDWREMVDADGRGEVHVIIDDRVKRRAVEIDQIHLVHREHEAADSDQFGEVAMSASWVSTPLRASTSSKARSAVEAPVTMLRVYCSCPGVSATMNLRFSLEK